MSSRIQVLRRATGAIVAATALLVGSTLVGTAAQADTRPPVANMPTTVSSDALPTAQINGVVWTQIIVGDIVYAAGTFTAARPAGAAAGVSTVARSNILAYRLSTGALIASFAPKVNGTVRALAASSDGTTIYVGGEFSSVNGSTTAPYLAAVSASTGALVTTFHPRPNSLVKSLARSGSTLYIGGQFTALGSTTRSRAAAVTTAGAVLPWAPAVADGRVDALSVNGTLGRVVLGGNFSGLNGRTDGNRGSGMVDATTGKTSYSWTVGNQVANWGPNTSITSLTSDGTNVYGTGYVYKAGTQGVLEGTFSASWATGTLRWVEDCHGDSYSSAVLGNAVYTAGHAHFCGNIGGFPETVPRTAHRAVAFSTAVTGTVAHDKLGYHDWYGNPAPSLLDWFPDINNGTFTGQGQGPWSVAASGSYVVYGGEFTVVNGKAQQGLVRFAVSSIAPNADGPRTSTGDLTVAAKRSGTTVTTSWTTVWDRDNTSLTYSLKRNGVVIATRTVSSTFWNRPSVSVADATPGTSPRYQVVATDPFGNAVSGPTSAAVAQTPSSTG